MESNEQYKWTNETEIDSDADNRLMVAWGEGGEETGRKWWRIKKY